MRRTRWSHTLYCQCHAHSVLTETHKASLTQTILSSLATKYLHLKKKKTCRLQGFHCRTILSPVPNGLLATRMRSRVVITNIYRLRTVRGAAACGV